MPSGTAIRARFERALSIMKGSAFPVYLRETAVVAGNDLLGIGVERQTVDTLVDPPPTVRQVSADEVATSGGFFQFGDFRMVCPGSITRDKFRNSLVLYGDQILKIIRVDESVIDGTVVAWTITARSVQPGD